MGVLEDNIKEFDKAAKDLLSQINNNNKITVEDVSQYLQLIFAKGVACARNMDQEVLDKAYDAVKAYEEQVETYRRSLQ